MVRVGGKSILLGWKFRRKLNHFYFVRKENRIQGKNKSNILVLTYFVFKNIEKESSPII